MANFESPYHEIRELYFIGEIGILFLWVLRMYPTP